MSEASLGNRKTLGVTDCPLLVVISHDTIGLMFRQRDHSGFSHITIVYSLPSMNLYEIIPN